MGAGAVANILVVLVFVFFIVFVLDIVVAVSTVLLLLFYLIIIYFVQRAVALPVAASRAVGGPSHSGVLAAQLRDQTDAQSYFCKQRTPTVFVCYFNHIVIFSDRHDDIVLKQVSFGALHRPVTLC